MHNFAVTGKLGAGLSALCSCGQDEGESGVGSEGREWIAKAPGFKALGVDEMR